MTDDDGLARYARRVGPVNKQRNLAIIERYLAWGGDDTDAALGRYLRDRAANGLQLSTLDKERRAIRAFYRHLGQDPPAAPALRFDAAQDSHRVAVSPGVILTLIEAACAGQLTHRQTAVLALATTYGMRVQELAQVRPEDVHLEDPARLYVRTAKGGRARWQWIPPEIRPYLRVAWPRTSPRTLDRELADLMARAGLEKPRGLGYHAIRRALSRDLDRAGVTDGDRIRFFRWKGGGDPTIQLSRRYAEPTDEWGGLATVTPVAPTEDVAALDGEVWARHPYLAWWDPS